MPTRYDTEQPILQSGQGNILSVNRASWPQGRGLMGSIICDIRSYMRPRGMPTRVPFAVANRPVQTETNLLNGIFERHAHDLIAVYCNDARLSCRSGLGQRKDSFGAHTAALNNARHTRQISTTVFVITTTSTAAITTITTIAAAAAATATTTTTTITTTTTTTTTTTFGFV